MRVRIEHASNPMNYGTNMMVTNFMYYLNKEIKKNITFVLDVFTEEDLSRYKEQCSKLNIERETIDYNFYYSKNIIERIVNKIKREFLFQCFNKINLKKLQDSADAVIILGGDDLSEYYGVNSLMRELNRIKFISNKMNFLLVGQTIGPFSNSRKEIVKNSLNRVRIYSREPLTKEYLQGEVGIQNVIVSSDLALLPLPGQENQYEELHILSKYNLMKNNYITLIPSGLYRSYCEDKKVYIDNIIEIINNIKVNTSFDIVLLPHVLRPQNVDDRNIIKLIEEFYGLDERITYIYDAMSPLEARYILGNGKLTISGRMHGALSTLQMRKPAISISYSVKYKGVIVRDLQLEELIVQGDDKRLWINRSVARETIEKITHVLCNYDNFINRIDNAVIRSEEKVRNMIKDISNNIYLGD